MSEQANRSDGMPRSVDTDFIDEIRKPQYLVELGDEPFVDFGELPFMSGLWTSANIDIYERHSDVLKNVQRSSKTDSEYQKKYNDLHRRARYLEIGERTANGTVAALFSILESAQAGIRVGAIRESSAHSDHGISHVRRVKMAAHLLTLVYPDLQYAGWENFASLSLFSQFHDVGQIPALLWNKENPERQIKIKAGHAEEGAVIVDALLGVIAQQGNMTEDLARPVSGVAAVMIMSHDIPEKIIERLNGRVRQIGATTVSINYCRK